MHTVALVRSVSDSELGVRSPLTDTSGASLPMMCIDGVSPSARACSSAHH